MTVIFVDSSYYIALVSPLDQQHDKAKEIDTYLSEHGYLHLITSNVVLSEVLAYFSKSTRCKPELRQAVGDAVTMLLKNRKFQVEELSSKLFDKSVTRYINRLDKCYSLVDCSSMTIMENLGVKGVISFDGDFEDEGFIQIREESEFSKVV